jgi:hypothetical protein
MMLRSMIEMAKKLKMKPEQDFGQASANQDASQEMPDQDETMDAEEQVNAKEQQQRQPFQKSEKKKSPPLKKR